MRVVAVQQKTPTVRIDALPDSHLPDAEATNMPGFDAPRWPGRLLGLIVVLALGTLIGLAWLWIRRNPMLSTWDEVMHLNLSMGDAMVLRSGDLAALRDALLLQDRWLPPGLRLLGLPVAAAFPADPQTALRLLASVMTALTAGVIWLGLRRVAGAAGAAAGVLVYLLAPLNMVGAQSFMTELPLHFAAACALALLLQEAVAPRPSFWRLALLGPVLGLGALASSPSCRPSASPGRASPSGAGGRTATRRPCGCACCCQRSGSPWSPGPSTC
jgi:hypothetical protein